ncbi:MAG: MBL fold hydrolase [Elusimicrobia bacterium RIFOXYB2_FULL_50_12]|nr:MAG: MBL fold hydrolase [Elusimicrobia bacterium RIFOXYB2_FULL_50_12]
MTLRELKPGVHTVGAIDWDRPLFDEIIPLPDGTTYNSYVIKASEKTALIDTVDPSKTHELIANLNALGISHIDYIIANHAEQDHSGSLPKILSLYPGAKIVTNPKCKDFLKELLLLPDEDFITVEDRQTLSLGDRTLEFIYAPWVHWPETMFTYLREDKILFTCDFLGSHLATSDTYADNEAKVYESAKRYYAEIMMPFRTIITKNLEKIRDLDYTIAAPSHGPVYRNPKFIINAYNEWTSDKVKNEVVIPFVSMHGSTRIMVDYLMKALMKRNITVKPFNLPHADIGQIAMALVDAATLVLASPTFLVGPHPAAAYAATVVNALRPKLKFVSLMGSYGWGGKMPEQLTAILTNIKAEIIPPVIVHGQPRGNDFTLIDTLAESIQKKHQALLG